SVVRGYMGVVIQDVTPELQSTLKLQNVEGAVISTVEKDSPAQKAGLKPYDVITSVDGRPVHSNAEVRNLISSLKPGSKTKLGIIRDGKPMTVDVLLTQTKEEKTAGGANPSEKQEKLG